MSAEVFKGDSVAPGVAAGPLRVPLQHRPESVERAGAVDPALEADRFRRRVEQLALQIEELAERLEAGALHAEAEIVRTHRTMLRDPEFEARVVDLIEQQRHRAETAVEQVLQSMAATLAEADDPVIAQRAGDLRDLAERLAAGLSGSSGSAVALPEAQARHAILAVPELTPSVVLDARELGVAGFVVAYGTSLSHGAILAKSFDMPVVRVPCLESMTQFAGRRVLVSGSGEVVIDPTDADLEARRPTVSPGSIHAGRIRVPLGLWVSIAEPRQLEAMEWEGIEGVGLYRSETFFMRQRGGFPSEEEQLAEYRRLFRLAGEKPVVFRTADLGADKPLEHIRFGPQTNPGLGLRAHRLFTFHPEILITQVRAVLRAAQGPHRLRLMFPMLETLDQLRFVQSLVGQAVRSLEEEGIPFQKRFQQGLLVETPSAAWSFPRLLREVDFASVGTNDLVQYLFAVERDTANVAAFYQPDHPVFLEVLHTLARQAREAGKPLSVCGEMASEPSMVPLLVGLGITDVSLVPGSVPVVSEILGSKAIAECRRLAQRCLAQETADEVRALLGRSSSAAPAGRVPTDGEAVDPVCGMVVRMADTPYRLRSGPLTRYFCSEACLERFAAGCAE